MWIEVFKTGTHTDSNGSVAQYTEQDLSAIAEQYNTAIAQDSSNIAPIVKGHPKTEDPAYGWVQKLKVSGQKLLAKVTEIVPEFAEEVKQGRYKKISIALYPDKMLRHVGFLGAVSPAVKGLAPVAFADKGQYLQYSIAPIADNEIEILKKENSNLKKKIFTLEQEKQETEYNEFIDDLISKSKITPHQAKSLKTILMKASGSHQYSDGDCLSDMIMEFASNLNVMAGLQGEFAQNNVPLDDDKFATKNTSPERMALHNSATAISRDNPNISYEQAIMLAINQ